MHYFSLFEANNVLEMLLINIFFYFLFFAMIVEEEAVEMNSTARHSVGGVIMAGLSYVKGGGLS